MSKPHSVRVTVKSTAGMNAMEAALRAHFKAYKTIGCGLCGMWFTSADDTIAHARIHRQGKSL